MDIGKHTIWQYDACQSSLRRNPVAAIVVVTMIFLPFSFTFPTKLEIKFHKNNKGSCKAAAAEQRPAAFSKKAAYAGLQVSDLFSNFAPAFRENTIIMTSIRIANIHKINKIHDFHSWGVAALI